MVLPVAQHEFLIEESAGPAELQNRLAVNTLPVLKGREAAESALLESSAGIIAHCRYVVIMISAMQ